MADLRNKKYPVELRAKQRDTVREPTSTTYDEQRKKVKNPKMEGPTEIAPRLTGVTLGPGRGSGGKDETVDDG